MNTVTVFFFSFLFSLASFSQTEGVESQDIVLDIQSTQLYPDHTAAQQQKTLKINLIVKPGYKAYVDKFHLNILEPYPTKYTTLELNPIHTFYDKFSRSNKKGIKESGTLTTTIEIQEPLKSGSHQLVFELRFQACSETICYFPQTIKKQIEFTVVNPPSSESEDNSSKNLLEENFASAQKRGITYLLFFVFLAGVLTSLTPCLLPMLPLTIAVIGKGHSHDSKLKKFINALTYVLGIATTYSILGLLAASSGALFGNILSNIWTQIGFGLAFVAMGLAQFGLFEFQTPLWLQNKMHHLGRHTGGVFLSGLISGLIASPCVGPVLVGILTFIAQTQDHFLGFWLMFVYALGLGQLLIILGVFSSLLTRFPRSPWIMKTSKTILGLALIASGLFYLSLIWPKQNLFKGPSHNGNSSATAAQNKIPWQTYSEQALADAQTAGKPVLIDFFADWCLACHELEEKTFSAPEIQESLKNFVLLRFDATNDSPELAALRKKYQIVGLPTVIFYDRQGQWIKDRTLNEFESPEKFKERLTPFIQ